ncbi:MAG TPA: multiheme c-type cytochrome [Polyangia bacterium]|nr:multiheme c-type cytochrome [Polyangia bacterium]
MWHALPLLVTMVATAEVKGTPEPCGCTSDPLGDVARVATLAKGGLWLDAGSLSYNREELSAERRPQADATAAALAHIYGRALVGLGADDLAAATAAAVARVRPPRQACNARGMALAAPRVETIDGVKIGVFGVVTPERVEPVKAGEPGAAAKRAVAQLRKQGAEVVVALCGMDRLEARRLVKAVPGIAFAVFGADVGDGMAEPEPVPTSDGDAWLMAPADLARYAVKLTVERRGDGPFALYAGAAARKLELDRDDRRIATLKLQLGEWKKDATADKAFVAARQQELDALTGERAKLATGAPPPPPSTGNWFSYELVPVRHVIPRDPEIAGELRKLAQTIGRVNLAATKDQPPPPAEQGAATYVGVDACTKCHEPAVDFWKKSVHAEAWKTLVEVDKQYHYDCIGCHVTGWEKPGGVNLATVEKRALVDVQCETCHGPGSKHVAEAGLDDPPTLVRRPPDRFCADNCHTKEHSDTFQLVPYLRDILGKGHGDKARVALGNGVTGHELRKKALEAAGR